MEGSNDITRVLGYNLLIRPRVQLYLYSGVNYNLLVFRPLKTQLD